VLGVLYLVVNEGYASSSRPQLTRTDLAGEATGLLALLRRPPPGADGDEATLERPPAPLRTLCLDASALDAGTPGRRDAGTPGRTAFSRFTQEISYYQ
jgi:hypothetical protein